MIGAVRLDDGGGRTVAAQAADTGGGKHLAAAVLLRGIRLLKSAFGAHQCAIWRVWAL